MKKLQIIPPHQIVTKKEISELERRIGKVLPRDYVEFLLLGNGGSLDTNNSVLPVAGLAPGGDVPINFFYLPIPEEDEPHRSIYVPIAWYHNRIPSAMLPIAEDEFGNLLLILLAGDDLGAIFFWDHENEGFDSDPDDRHNTHIVAPNLGDLVERLEPWPH